MKDFKKDALDAHNEFRGKHGAPAMKWSSKLEARAQQWANEIAKKGYLQHDNQKEDGENIACMKGKSFISICNISSRGNVAFNPNIICNVRMQFDVRSQLNWDSCKINQ